ncbi:MAG: NAD(P)H-hydrate dehydratase [Clostridiales Family XIII bacterium]|nr:NAD(P)H-hydrate dehydratase [Clostridiales Family XIII bacterium]
MGITEVTVAVTEITRKEIKELLAARRRRRDAHKGDFGRVLIAAGSFGMAGAAVLCARAALRTGSGLVTVSIDEALWPIVQTAVPEATCVSRAELAPLRYDAVAIGPGLGTDAAAIAALATVLEGFSGPLVLDADALNILARVRSHVPLTNAVLTPHAGEAARLLAGAGDGGRWRSAADVQADREGAIAALAEKYGAAATVL